MCILLRENFPLCGNLVFILQQIWQKGSAKFTDQNTFLENSRDQVDKIIDQLHLFPVYVLNQIMLGNFANNIY